MHDLILIVRMAGRRVAVPASEVEAVVELEGITPAPRAAPHVSGLSALRSRVLTVIDAMAALELGCALESSTFEAIVVNSGGHPYALLVDEVEDVVEAGAQAAIRAPIGAGWDRVATAMVDAGEDLLLLVDPHLVIAGPAAQAA